MLDLEGWDLLILINEVHLSVGEKVEPLLVLHVVVLAVKSPAWQMTQRPTTSKCPGHPGSIVLVCKHRPEPPRVSLETDLFEVAVER